MKKNRLFHVLAFLCGAFQVAAQNTSITSPVVYTDGTVTFQCVAPKADDVRVWGTMLPAKYRVKTPVMAIEREKKQKMTQSDSGVWQYTTGALASDMYVYRFIIDDVDSLDALNSRVVREGPDRYSSFIVPGGMGDYYKKRQVPHGKVTFEWYPSKMDGWERRRMAVYTPPAYDAEPENRYPVLYLLHGSGGDEESWIEMGCACEILDNMTAEGLIPPMIVVMPNGNADMDAAAGKGVSKLAESNNKKSMLGDIESVFVSDIVNYVDKQYRTQADAGHRAIAGLSLGGLHTLFITLNNPDVFDYVGLFSAQTTNALNDRRIGIVEGFSKFKKEMGRAFSTNPFAPSREEVTTDDNGTLYIYKDVDEKIDSLKASDPELLYIAVGEDDFVKKLNDDFRELLDENEVEYHYNETDGGHTWSNWRKYLLDFLSRLFKEDQ